MGARCCAPNQRHLHKRLEEERYVKSRDGSAATDRFNGESSREINRPLSPRARSCEIVRVTNGIGNGTSNQYSANYRRDQEITRSREIERHDINGANYHAREAQKMSRSESRGQDAYRSDGGEPQTEKFFRESVYRQSIGENRMRINLKSSRRVVEYSASISTQDVEEEERRRRLEGWMNAQPLSMRRLERSDREIAMLGDERDNIQKKTFTKWVNKHLLKASVKIDDLFSDLRDGNALISLLEVLTGERLNREKGYTRFHRIQNVQYCLDFLKRRNIKLVNIRPEDIIEGNSKLTLGLIWTIILNFQVSVIKQRQLEQSLSHSASTRSGHQVTALLLPRPPTSPFLDLTDQKDPKLEQDAAPNCRIC